MCDSLLANSECHSSSISTLIQEQLQQRAFKSLQQWLKGFLLTLSAFWQRAATLEKTTTSLQTTTFFMDRRMDEWIDGCMEGCVDGGINRSSRRLFGCSRWRSSRWRGGEGPRFPSSAFHYDAPWQHGEWMCGRMYSLPISTSSA